MPADLPGQQERDELLALIYPMTERYLRRFTRADSLTIEAGCGPGQYRYAVNGDYIGFDITSDDYKPGIPRNLDLIADARKMPFKNPGADLVFFSNAFHYFDQAGEISQRISSLLASSGRFLIFDYSKKTLKRLNGVYTETNQGFKAVEYSAEDWKAMLLASGFQNVSVEVCSPLRKRIFFKFLAFLLGDKTAFRWLDRQSAALVVIGEKKP